jgi:hypothetical protein
MVAARRAAAERLEHKEATMNGTRRTRLGTAALTLGAMFVFVYSAGATISKTEVAQANRALEIRSEAMNQRYHTAALNALQVRSEALDRRYHLGGSTPTQAVDTGAAAQRALMIRSDALNRHYHLGSYAVVVRPSNGFDWTDAGVGGAATLGLVLVATGLAVGTWRYRHVHPGHAQTS